MDGAICWAARRWDWPGVVFSLPFAQLPGPGGAAVGPVDPGSDDFRGPAQTTPELTVRPGWRPAPDPRAEPLL